MERHHIRQSAAQHGSSVLRAINMQTERKRKRKKLAAEITLKGKLVWKHRVEGHDKVAN
jgi:hypothetical protein